MLRLCTLAGVTASDKAQALAADLRYVLRKHQARVVWREELDGRVTVSAVIEAVPEGKVLVGWMGPQPPRWLVIVFVIALASYMAVALLSAIGKF